MIKNFIKVLMVYAILLFSLTSCNRRNDDHNHYEEENADGIENIINDNSWYINDMNYNKLWNYSKGDSQIIAFIDSGISPELENEYGDRIVYKCNVVDNTDNVNDDESHGTEMVSIACNDGIKDVYGLALKSKIIIIKATLEGGRTNSEYLVKAFNEAISHGATIINVSLGSYKNDEELEEVVKEAISKNITVVASAGDYGDKDLLYPAKFESVVSIQGLDKKYKLWENSNYEDIATNTFPCEDIKSLGIDINGKICLSKSSGTSQATALATGYVSLVKDYYLKLNDTEISNDELLHIIGEINTSNKSKEEYISVFEKIKSK